MFFTAFEGAGATWPFFNILLPDIVHNVARTAPLCGIVWAEKLLDHTDPMHRSLDQASPLGSAR
jgi:hypothetical protein